MKTNNLESKHNNFWKAVLFALLLAAWVSIPAWTGSSSAEVLSSIERSAILTPPNGGSNLNGAALWELDDNGRREIDVEVVNINLPVGTSLSVVIDGSVISQASVDSFLRMRLRLRTQDGQQVPVVNVGSTAQVRNGTTVLVSGIFVNGGTPSPSQSGTGTGTGSPSPSQSGTGTATGTNTATPSQSGTGTPSPSQSGTATGTNTSTPSPSQSQTGTGTPSPSQSGTATGTNTSSPSPSPSPIVVRTAILRAPNAVNPFGDAKWELFANNNRDLEIEVRNLNLSQGTVLTAFVDQVNIGTAAVDNNQRFRLKIRTQDGQVVPFVNNGSTVDVRLGSTVLVNGIFGNGTPTGTGTATGTNTATPSQSGTPNNTPSPSQTGTASGTNTATPSPSQSGTPNNTPSPSQTGTASPSQTGTPGNTPSPSQTGTGTATASPSPSPNGNNLFASLTGPTLNGVLPTGFAEYEIHSSRTELEVRVRQVNLAPGTSLAVVVDGVTVGSMTVRSGGEAELRLRSDNGQNVPTVIVGSTIAVINGNSAILSGTFSSFASPSPSQTGTPGNTPSPSQTGTPGNTPSPSQTGTPNNTPSPSQTGTPSGTPSPSQFGRSLEAHLTGSQVNPPVATVATSEIKVVLSADQTQATVFGEFHNLSSNQTGAIIETTLGMPVTIRNLGVVGGQNGRFARTTFAVSAAQVQQLRSGLWSAVIMSVNNPNGEIRGTFRHHSRHSDFDGDGSHDFSVYRPSSGTWYSQNTNGFNALPFGTFEDRVVSADYDGDGKTDAAVFRNSNGQGIWYINRSSDGGMTTAFWGLGTDIPLRGDFNGDGRSDVSVYRPSTGTWYILQDNNAIRAERFGVAEDLPVPADMDGDGLDDLVVYRPSQGNWYWTRSSDNQFVAVNFGLSTDIPVRGDFDGDGKGDVTVYRPSTGIWYTLRSVDGGFQATQFGINVDIPVAGNYDADGKTDIAVFRPTDGNWYVLRSSDNVFQAFQFGLHGDIPAIAR
ncbi:MAG: CHRD domain-containing protein [Pyrinomonadaceae bacterium]